MEETGSGDPTYASPLPQPPRQPEAGERSRLLLDFQTSALHERLWWLRASTILREGRGSGKALLSRFPPQGRGSARAKPCMRPGRVSFWQGCPGKATSIPSASSCWIRGSFLSGGGCRRVQFFFYQRLKFPQTSTFPRLFCHQVKPLPKVAGLLSFHLTLQEVLASLCVVPGS